MRTAQVAPPPAPLQPQLPLTVPATYNDPGAMLAGLL
jgi:AP-2 complex subunit alpha